MIFICFLSEIKTYCTECNIQHIKTRATIKQKNQQMFNQKDFLYELIELNEWDKKKCYYSWAIHLLLTLYILNECKNLRNVKTHDVALLKQNKICELFIFRRLIQVFISFLSKIVKNYTCTDNRISTNFFFCLFSVSPICCEVCTR